MERDRERVTEMIRERYSIRGEPGPRLHRHQERATGADPKGGDTGVRGTPYPGEVTRHQHYVTGFKHLVDRARELRLSQGPSVSPPVCMSLSSDSGHSVPASPTRPTIQGIRRLPALPSTTHRYGSPPDNPAAYETGRDAGKSPSTSPTPSATNDSARKLEPYLASIDIRLIQITCG